MGRGAFRPMAGGNMLQIIGQHVSDDQAIWTTVADWLVFFSDVLREGFLSALDLTFTAASAAFARSVADKPDSLFWVEIEPWPFGSTRHFSLISLMARGVTKSRRPILSITRLPLAASARNVDGAMTPRNIVSHASASVIGVSSSMDGGI
ncbi:hypothetical protein ACT6QG_05530 [Xanthobacter sp. TB0136]|uniref:hypothetical protein n=1 Tax=Xanthobacter sp. TB0136 TaxID=3459177 RepID=UPI004039789B